mgnify:CR=1 FL=1
MEDVTKVVKNVMNNIGLEVQKPKGKCEDEKCPWHGHLKVRGRMFRGTVVAAKVPLTAVVEWNYYNYIHKYERYSPACGVEVELWNSGQSITLCTRTVAVLQQERM